MKPFFLSILCCLSLSCLSAEAQDGTNSIIVCDNGVEMLAWDLQFLDEAKRSIEILACFFGGEVADELLTHVAACLERQELLQVHILASPLLLTANNWAAIDSLLKKYPENFHIQFSTQVVQLLPDVSTIDNHVKMLIVDETYFSAGGTNLEDSHCTVGTFAPEALSNEKASLANYLPGGMRDQDIVGKGPLARQLRKEFFKFYSLWEYYTHTMVLEKDPEVFKNNSTYFEVTENGWVQSFEQAEQKLEVDPDKIKVIVGGPHQYENAITSEYVRLIKEAKQEIVIENLFFFPLDPIMQALMEAVNRGIRLTVVTNGISEISPSANSLFCWANRMSYIPIFYGRTFNFWDSIQNQELKKTSVYEYHVENVILHKKTMLIDGKTFVIGSYNLGYKSAYRDYELLLVIESNEAARAARHVFEKDLHYSRAVSPEEAAGWYFDPLKAYLGQMQKKFRGFL